MEEKDKRKDCEDLRAKGIIAKKDLWRRVKVQAALEDKTMNSWVVEAISEKLNGKPVN